MREPHETAEMTFKFSVLAGRGSDDLRGDRTPALTQCCERLLQLTRRLHSSHSREHSVSMKIEEAMLGAAREGLIAD